MTVLIIQFDLFHIRKSIQGFQSEFRRFVPDRAENDTDTVLIDDHGINDADADRDCIGAFGFFCFFGMFVRKLLFGLLFFGYRYRYRKDQDECQ